VDPRIATDDDRPAGAGRLRSERGSERAHGRIVEITVRNTADVVLAKRSGIHPS
jgi:hypothetical protein